MEPSLAIRVFGARTHNLREIKVAIPHGTLTVITGVSGSGKSSLAFDTIFAEGRHRYLSSVSARSRELLLGVDRPDVDFIDGLPPVLCVEQRLRGARKRATVATTSDIYDYLRLLFARVGQLHCPTCRQPVSTQSRAAIVEQAMRLQDRQKVVILAPIVRGKVGSHADVMARIVKDGYVRARIDGEIIDASSPPEINKSTPHNIEIVVDRLIIKEGIQSRLEESIDLAIQLGQGQCLISHEVAGSWKDRLYSTRLACVSCGISFATLEPRSFSFNSAAGACSKCHGLGVTPGEDDVEQLCDACQGTRLGPIPRAVLIDGTNITDFCQRGPTNAVETLDRWMAMFSVSSKLESKDSEVASRVASQHILPEIATRLRFLIDLGLDYLTLDRDCETLSAGERQRTRLVACLGTELTGVCYILDEPTTGLHPRDTQRLLQTLFRLRDQGNTVLLVEHDLEVIRQSDHVIDLGPGAGILGGHVLAVGTPAELACNPASITGQFLILDGSQKEARVSCAVSDIPTFTANDSHERVSSCHELSILKITKTTLHNLKNVTLEIPLRRIVCVTGVSGSGKTSLIMHTLVPAIRRALGERTSRPGPFGELSGVEQLTRMVRVDQSPLGRSARSSPATYSGIWDEIRKLFAKTKESRLRGLLPRNFSLAVADARCARCAGQGQLPVDEKRFADWTLRCPDCDGRRFAPAILSVRYRGKSVADVLEMSVAAAAAFFQNLPRLAKTLSVWSDLGLGYLKLGQSAMTLSGGEAQRIKLGTELAKSSGMDGSTLFVLDEPTSGLHVSDVQQLVQVLRNLVNEGHSVVVIEHNTQLIAAVDWIIQMGPGAGPYGGQIVSAGSQNNDSQNPPLGLP